MPIHYLVLLLAVLSETIGTAALQASQQFTKFWPSVVVVIAYAISFYFLSIALRAIPLGIAYAFWSGVIYAKPTFLMCLSLVSSPCE